MGTFFGMRDWCSGDCRYDIFVWRPLEKPGVIALTFITPAWYLHHPATVHRTRGNMMYDRNNATIVQYAAASQ